MYISKNTNKQKKQTVIFFLCLNYKHLEEVLAACLTVQPLSDSLPVSYHIVQHSQQESTDPMMSNLQSDHLQHIFM